MLLRLLLKELKLYRTWSKSRNSRSHWLALKNLAGLVQKNISHQCMTKKVAVDFTYTSLFHQNGDNGKLILDFLHQEQSWSWCCKHQWLLLSVSNCFHDKGKDLVTKRCWSYSKAYDVAKAEKLQLKLLQKSKWRLKQASADYKCIRT